MRISALIPDSWTVTEPTEHSIRFFAPADDHHSESLPTFSIVLGEPDGFAPDGFAGFCDASLGRLELEIPGCTWDSDRELVQLQALGPLERYHLYLVNVAAPLPLARTYTPVFDAIIRSLRVLPL